MKTATALMIFVGLLFVSTSFYSTHSYFSDAGRSQENVLSAADWQTPEEAAQEIGEVLEASASALYQLTGGDFQNTFSKADFEAAIKASGIEVERVAVVEEPRIFGVRGEWAELVLDLTLSDGSTGRFRVILQKENGLWRIFGTEEIAP